MAAPLGNNQSQSKDAFNWPDLVYYDNVPEAVQTPRVVVVPYGLVSTILDLCGIIPMWLYRPHTITCIMSSHEYPTHAQYGHWELSLVKHCPVIASIVLQTIFDLSYSHAHTVRRQYVFTSQRWSEYPSLWPLDLQAVYTNKQTNIVRYLTGRILMWAESQTLIGGKAVLMYLTWSCWVV